MIVDGRFKQYRDRVFARRQVALRLDRAVPLAHSTDCDFKTPKVFPILRHMAAPAIFLVLILLLAGCAGAPTTPCPDPDPDPNSPCATSHSHTYDGRS